MLYLASDHAGYELKNKIAEFLKHNGIPFEDIGPHNYDESDDYPDYIIPAAKKVAANSENKGIILGGSGQGEAITANKIKGIRAALYYGGQKEIITLSRIHNDANILSLGARFIKMEEVIAIVKLWLKTDFSKEERHRRRIEKIQQFETL